MSARLLMGRKILRRPCSRTFSLQFRLISSRISVSYQAPRTLKQIWSLQTLVKLRSRLALLLNLYFVKYGLEVSYNACGVFSHMLSDGADVWTVASPSREDILEAMSQAINKWPIDATRNINYRLCNCSNLKTLFIR